MSTQVARIGGQLLQDNLLRELADLKFDNDLLVVKRDNTLGINTTTTPRNLTINGTLRTASGGSDPDIILGNSFKVGDLTLATTGISTASGNITLSSTHPQGYITTTVLAVITLQLKAMVFKPYKQTAALVLGQKYLTDKQRLGTAMVTMEIIGIQDQR